MILAVVGQIGLTVGGPRASGDDPISFYVADSGEKWTVFQRVLSIYKEFLFRFQGFLFPIPGIISLQHTEGNKKVDPARAGMIRRSGCWPVRRTGGPRASGDDPIIFRMQKYPEAWTPRERG